MLNGPWFTAPGGATCLALLSRPAGAAKGNGLLGPCCALDRHGQNFGEAFPYQAKDPMTTRLLAEVRREARNAPRMYGEISGETGHN